MTSSLLKPSYSLTLGNQRFTEQAIEIRVTLESGPVVDSMTVTFPVHVDLSAATDDAAGLTMNNGENESAVFTGKIEAIHRGFDALRVRVLNSGGTLARFRPAATYEQVNAGGVARSLCSETGVNTGDIEDGVDLAFYAADPSRNAYEHISRIAEWSGAIARISAENELQTVIVNATTPDLALRYGRELKSIVQESRPAILENFVAAGESGAGSTSIPEAARLTTDFFAGNRPDGPGMKARWLSEPALRTAAAAATAGAARQRVYTSSRLRGNFKAFLLPQLRAGTVVQIQDLPDGLARDVVWLRRVRHIIGPRGATTSADFFRGGDSFNPKALLGAALGALSSAL